MKDFTYVDSEFNLHAHACEWLRDMGLKETRWVLDREWFFSYDSQMTLSEWIDK